MRQPLFYISEVKESMAESNITKRAIAQSLKELANEKSFDKISIADITARCGLNRQTFYYHFRDKYELLNWIFYREAFVPLLHGTTFDNWHEKVLEILSIMKREKRFYMNTVKNGDGYFQEYLMSVTCNLFQEAIDALDIGNKIAEKDKEFFSRFFAYGVSGIIAEWVISGMQDTPEHLAGELKFLAVSCEELANKRFLEMREPK